MGRHNRYFSKILYIPRQYIVLSMYIKIDKAQTRGDETKFAATPNKILQSDVFSNKQIYLCTPGNTLLLI